MKIQLRQTNEVLKLFSYSSLTDIVLLLLIFFLLTSSFIVSSGIKVRLPDAKYSSAAEQKQVYVTLVSSGEIYVNARLVEADSLASVLARTVVKPKEQVVVLSSDKDVPLERAVFVLDAAKSIGAERFFIATTQPKLTEPENGDDRSAQ